jgi:hypothetical protein
MATNEILRFAETDTGTNLLTQAEYLADSQRPIGNQPGVARSKLVNKALRQASLISAGVAEYIADNQANNITDALTPQNIADYLQAAITGALGVTPPQFDNDTSLATTAFVKRAGLEMNVFFSYSSGATIPVSAVGAPIQLAQATTQSYIVPLASSCPSGSVLYFANTGTGAALIARSGSDTFSVASGADTGITILTGDQLMLVSNGGNQWFAIGGSASLLFSAGFNHQKAASGFQRLPSGLIIQWGNATTSTTSAQSVTFPISFPNGVLQVVVSCLEASGNSLRMAVVNSYNGVSGFTFSGYAASGGAALSPASGVRANYIAIGY